MFTKEFIEDYSLFRKLKLNSPLSSELSNWSQIPINMICHICNSNQTFNLVNDYGYKFIQYSDSEENYASDRVIPLKYKCQSCKDFERYFYIYVNSNRDEIYKVGQYPQWEIKTDKSLEKVLHKHLGNFKKGLVCESQGYGIGAFSYYRRITEDIIDELLDSIKDLIEEENKAKYQEALEKTKHTRVTQEKIELIKDLLPSILKPCNVNPLGVLHSELSGGLHSESDEVCLEKANHIKSILTFLINQILKSKEDAKNFTDSMKFLLDKKSGK